MTAELQTVEQTTEQTAQALIQILTLNKNTGAALEKLLKLPLLDADNKIPAGVLRIVGALSDGHIIESGDNVNGYYVRFADGTQWCYGKVYSVFSNTSGKTIVITFPAEFSDMDYDCTAIATAGAYAHITVARVVPVSISSSNIYAYPSGSTTVDGSNVPFVWLAVGRWK